MSQATQHTEQALATQHPGEKLTEIILSCQQFNAIDAVLPMLAYLSHQSTERWLTWIAPPADINRELLIAFGFNLERIRLIHPASQHDASWLFWNALKQGNSATVVISGNKLNEKELLACEQAAAMGDARALVLRYR